MKRRSRDEHDNPAWPGLVDLFAFGMVIMIVMWVGARSVVRGSAEDLQKELDKARRKAVALETRIDSLRTRVGIFERNSPGSQPWEIIQREQRKAAQDIIDRLRDIFGPAWKPAESTDVEKNRIVVDDFLGRRIGFDTGLAVLQPEDIELLRVYAAKLDSVVMIPTCEILINGQADPRPLPDRGVHPRDNVELSALRAAAVARIFREASVELGARTQVVGLGEVGENAPPGMPKVEQDEFYRRFRTVRLVFRADLSRR